MTDSFPVPIVVVDSGVANAQSVINMLRKVGAPAQLSDDPAVIAGARKLILPGVGAFDAGMRSLRRKGLVDVLDQAVRGDHIPILGICLGMQLFAAGSEEGDEPGLGWIDADVVRFRFDGDNPPKVPHMGWNVVAPLPQSTLFRDLPADARFYFVHSYHLRAANDSLVAGRTTYGYEFASAIEDRNVMGVQFHPEKSHRFGLALLRRFAQR